MISSLIVFGSLGLAIVFTTAYVFSPSLRQKVEQPKYDFLDQLAQAQLPRRIELAAEKEAKHD